MDTPKEFRLNGERNLRLDSNDHPHAAYGGDHLYYAWHDGVSWHKEVVDATPGTGDYVSLALDSRDRPHISYTEFTPFAYKPF